MGSGERAESSSPDPQADVGNGAPEPAAPVARARVPVRLLRWAWVAVRATVPFLVLAWATLAIYFSNLPWGWARVVLAAAFVALAVWARWGTRRRRAAGWALAAAFVGVVVWFASIAPSHDRTWRAEVAVMPRAAIDGDHVRLTGVRNFDYRAADDFTVRYEERAFSIARATSLDLYVSYWMPGPVAHTFVSFNFDDGTPPLCISIETRPEVGEGFDPVASMFKQFELIYVVGDERDIVGVRAAHRDEEVFLYHVRASPEGVRRMLRVYLERVNELADRAEFYHLLSNSCTINIVRYAGVAGREGRLDVRHLLNGWVDRYLFDGGWVDNTIPFDELRRQSRITDVARAATDAPDFSERIRASVPERGT